VSDTVPGSGGKLRGLACSPGLGFLAQVVFEYRYEALSLSLGQLRLLRGYLAGLARLLGRHHRSFT
jgi:hypothetical protein